MLRLLLLLGALAFTVAAKAHSVVPTARGGVPNERVVILPGKGEIKSYKAVPEDDQLDSEDVPGPLEVTIGPVATVEEEEYPDDEGGSGGYGDREREAQVGEEDSAGDNKLPVVNEQDGESDATTLGPEISVSGQEDAEMTTKPKRDSLSSPTYCLVSNSTVLLRYLAESRARCRNLTPTFPPFFQLEFFRVGESHA